MAPEELMLEKRPNIYWMLCATRALNPMFEGIGVTEREKSDHIIYAHYKTSVMMRKYTLRRDIVTSGICKFILNLTKLIRCVILHGLHSFARLTSSIDLST